MEQIKQKQREQLLIIALATTAFEELAEHDKLKPAHGDLRRSRTFAKKAIDRIFNELLSRDEVAKVKRLVNSSKIYIQPNTRPGQDEVVVGTTDLYNLASFAIHNHCLDCKKSDWKQCDLRATLHRNIIPTAHDDRGCCEFKQ